MITIHQSTLYRNNYVNFKSNNFDDGDDCCGFDDEISKERRDYIRSDYESRALPYYDVLENNGRLSEYQLTALVNRMLGVKPHSKKGSLSEQVSEMNEQNITPKDDLNKIDASIMEILPLHNVKPIISTGCYRGSTPNSNLDSVKMLKEAGVKHLVDLQGYDMVKKECEKNDIEYLYIPMEEDLSEINAFKSQRDIERNIMQWSHLCNNSPDEKKMLEQQKKRAVDRWELDKDNYIDKFVKMINLLQEGNTYIGCEYGISRTNNAMLLNYLFNPKATRTPSCRTKFNNEYMCNIVSFYQNLTPEHKEQMGWTEEFDEKFMPRLEKLRKSPIEY